MYIAQHVMQHNSEAVEDKSASYAKKDIGQIR